MALTPCTECGKQISTLAAACPNCGAPANIQYAADGLAVAPSSSGATPVVRTGGMYEGAGFLMIVMGMIVAMAAEPGFVDVFAKALAATGFVTFLIGRFK